MSAELVGPAPDQPAGRIGSKFLCSRPDPRQGFVGALNMWLESGLLAYRCHIVQV